MKRAPWFEIDNAFVFGKGFRYWFCIYAANGRIMAHSETYTRRSAALRACRAINPKVKVVEK